MAILVAGGVLAMSACHDSTMGPDASTGGGLTLAYAEGGQYQADGLPTFNGSEVAPGTFAVAFADSIGGLVLAGFRKSSGTRGDLFIVQLTALRTGDFDSCSMTSDCHGRLLENTDAANLQDVGTAWEIMDGSVQLEEAGPDRVIGTFGGLILQSKDGSASRAIEGGMFDLPLLSNDDGADIMRCFIGSLTGAPCQAA